jgi:hypothetical protein
MNVITGKVSFFGGRGDPGMRITEGLAFFEHSEADRRPDLFLPRGQDPTEGTSQRLRLDAYYLALQIPNDADRAAFQGTPYIVTNPKTGQSVLCSLVDRGPNQNTGRVADISPTALRVLRLQTDDDVEVRRAV